MPVSWRSLTAFDQDSTLVAVVEMSQSGWLVAGVVPGVEREPLKKLKPDEHALLEILHRWRDEALKAGRKITRMTVAYEAGRDGFWLARWLRARGIEASEQSGPTPGGAGGGKGRDQEECGAAKQGPNAE